MLSQNPTDLRSFVTCESCGGHVLMRATGRSRVQPYCDKPECRRRASAARARASRVGKRLPPIDAPLPREVRTVYGDYSVLISRDHCRCDLELRRLLEPIQRLASASVHADRIRYPPRSRKPSVQCDFRQSYADASVDVVVLDPPYTHCGHYLNNHRYGSALTDQMRHPEIMELYRAVIGEARRVLRPAKVPRVGLH